ncbi:DUF3817 domain-containing protein [Nonomuraea longicatena]|uniref:DUF3817 domain-containing protein n=1 Tax=Nonomuraea longicatena TaxID=83682 RepID=A0ABN1R0B6_9ACTN
MESALKPFRALAYAVGVMLIVLCIGMVLNYIVRVTWWPSLVIAQVHGFLYMVYLVAVMNLGMKARWSWPYMLGIMLGGTVPLLSFYVERRVTVRVADQLARAEAPA